MKTYFLIIISIILPVLTADAVNICFTGKKIGFSDVLDDGSFLVTGRPENRYNNWLAHILPMEVTAADRQILGISAGTEIKNVNILSAPAGKYIRISGEMKLDIKEGSVKVCLRQLDANGRTLQKDSYIGLDLSGNSYGWEKFEKTVYCSKSAKSIQFCIIAIKMGKDSTAQFRNVRWECVNSNVSAKKFELLPQAVVYKHPVSRSQWLWNSEKPVADKAKSYFRLKFSLPEKVVNAKFSINFDDKGKIFVNGKECSPENFISVLQTGENILAVELYNERSAAGVIFYGELKLASGKIVYLHSDTNVKSAASAVNGWNAPGFDDSAWPVAKTQGDVLSYPWARWHDYVPAFASAKEKKYINDATVAASSLPASLESEPEPQAKIVYSGTKPKISVNGKLHDPLLFLFSNNNKYPNQYNDNMVLKAARLGFKIYQLTISDLAFYKSDGQYDFSSIDSQVKRLLHLEPDALLMVHIAYSRMEKWCRQNPDERMEYAAGPVENSCYDERIGRPLRPSAASEKFKSEISNNIRSFAGYIKSQLWGKRVIAVRVSYGIYTEWHSYGMYNAPDTGKAMTGAFRKYLKNKYKDTAALQKAWHSKDVTFDTAAVPSQSERSRKNVFFLDPVKDRKVLDYYDCHANIIADLMLFMAKNVKENLPGRLCGAYYGYIFSTHPPEGANVLLDKVLSSPHIDFLCNPPPYTAISRQAGGDYMHRTVPATFRRFGKLVILEDDSRFHHIAKYSESFVTRSARESRMTVRRNICGAVFDSCGIQLADPLPGSGSRPGAFDDVDVLDAMRESFATVSAIAPLPAESGNDMAVVIHYPERLRHDGSPISTELLASLYVDTLPRLNRAGVAFDLLTLQDFLAKKQNYKTVLFLNAFSLSPAERNAVKAKIRHPGVTAIWMVAPGCVTDEGISDAAMSELVGIDLAGAGVIPAVRVTDPKVLQLKYGAVIKTLSDNSRAMFISKPLVSWTQWQELFRQAGVHIYTAPGSYFRRHGNLFMLHTGKSGRHTVTLPEEMKGRKVVELFSGKEYPIENIRMHTQGSNTWLFQIKENK